MDIGKDMKEIIKEEVIQFLKNIKTDDKDKINNVIGFLERGWKYEDMWGDLNFYKEVLVTAKCFITEKNLKISLGVIMYALEQKYFPPKFDKINKE